VRLLRRRPRLRLTRPVTGDLRSFVHDEFKLSYEVHGSGEKVVVLLHGILLDAGLNRQLAVDLARRGHRAVLLDLLGHGLSDKPRHASAHRIDLYARQVVGLLDELNIDQAVIGGVSLGADVALQVAAQAPGHVTGLILEMPVLEWAVPAAALLFVPMLLSVHYARPVVRLLTKTARRLPRSGFGPLDSVLDIASRDPDELAAVLHGVLLGPIAPTAEERAAIQTPAIVIGHRLDLIHPFSDAENLARQMPHARLVTARSALELRLRPKRLTNEIARFLGDLPTSQRTLRKVPRELPAETAAGGS
jgi:pimeloyl-ACP methyl ester carboxylesterase